MTVGATELASLNLDDNSKIGTPKEEAGTADKDGKKIEGDKPEQYDAIQETPDYDFGGPHDFGAVDEDFVGPFTATSSILTDSSAMNLTTNSRKDIFDLQQGRVHTGTFTPRPTFDMLLKPKNNPWLRK